MPNFVNKSEKQHSTEEANESRLVTEVRWLVDSVNEYIMEGFKHCASLFPIPFACDYVRNVCSLSDDVIAKQMMT